jgi:copper chaperone NosL
MSAARHAEAETSRAFVVVAALLMMMLTACSRPAAWPPVAADPDLGHDACAGCRMIVSDARFAAQYHARDERIDRDGAVEFFDDLGCLLAAHRGASCDPQGVFVRSFDDTRWIRGDEAFVVRSAAFVSPMAYGCAAFATRAAAEVEARSRADARLFELATLLRQDGSADGLASGPVSSGAIAGSKGNHP